MPSPNTVDDALVVADRLLRVPVGQELHRALQVGEEHGHRLPLPLRGRPKRSGSSRQGASGCTIQEIQSEPDAVQLKGRLGVHTRGRTLRSETRSHPLRLDNRREYCRRPDQHAFELLLAMDGIQPRTTQIRSPRSFVERMHYTLLDECFRVAGRTTSE